MLTSTLGPKDLLEVQALLAASLLPVEIEDELKQSWALARVARLDADSEAVGFLLAWWAADEVHLLQLATHPKARRKGVARRLLTELIEESRARGSRLMILEVRASNVAAINLYRSLGFEVMGVRRHYYADNGEDAFEMRLSLGEFRP
jgi:[ribosomal protein S18]-alanine N-acetyltransferase